MEAKAAGSRSTVDLWVKKGAALTSCSNLLLYFVRGVHRLLEAGRKGEW